MSKLKIDKIYSLFRKAHKLTLFNAVEEKHISKQYLTDGYCCYVLDDKLPTLGETSIAALIGCSSDDLLVEAKAQTPFIASIKSDAFCPSDRALAVERYNYFDYAVLSTWDNDCVLFADPKYLKPFDIGGDIDYSMRIVDDKPMIVVKNGMFVVAAITPVVFDDAQLTIHLNSIRKVQRELIEMQERLHTSLSKE